MRNRALALFLLLAALFPQARAASPRPSRAERGMVVAPESLSAEVGRGVLRRGGNAVDAAVAAAFALAVTYPRAGSLGGGGFAIVRLPGGEHAALDFRETAPAVLEAKLFLDERGEFVHERALTSGLGVGVPGLVAGLAAAHAKWGSRPWKELLAPAIELAEEGFEISERTAETIVEERERLAKDAGSRALFVPLRAGSRLRQPALARTLRRIADGGPEAFYRGPVAADVVATVRAAGGVMTLDDLSAYRVVWRKPVVGTFRGNTIVSFPPPSSGGIVLLQILGMLERWPAGSAGAGSSLAIHRFVEAERRAFADRARWMGDPERFDVPAAGLLDPAYLRARAATIEDDRATPSAELGPGSPPGTEGTHTLHLSVADARGGAVSLTTTLNSNYGSGILATGSGVLLNDEMDDFSIGGAPNQFGLVGGVANSVEGGKRPLSSMTPTIVEWPGGGTRPRMILGSPDGPRIISSVAQVILHVVDDGMDVAEAVDAPRVHDQWRPDCVAFEPRALSDDVAGALRARGHRLCPHGKMGNVAAIVTTSPDGPWTASPDPRRESAAAGY